MADFKPGDWTHPGLSRLERVRAYRAEFGGDISAAVAAADAEIYRQERDGRLRLAAAAPELLEALRQLLGNAVIARYHLTNDEGGNLIGSALWDTIGQAERAIEMATDARKAPAKKREKVT